MLFNFFYQSVLTGILIEMNKFYFIFLLFVLIQIYYFQLNKLDIKNPLNCLKIFKSNNLLGALVLTSIFLGKI